ncbi:MAG: hypothetical protein NTW92_08215 [Bacteroidetes bacterium]|nr:hypothetical protein [Bacteroidota bacterium]
MNELKTRGREAPDGLLFYFHNSKDADEQSEVGHPDLKRIFLDADEQSEVGNPDLKRIFLDADEQSEVGHPSLKKL